MIVLGLATLAGCRSVDPGEPDRPSPAKAERVAAPASERAVAHGSAVAETATVEVVVEGASGMVVVNRQPVGLAPQRVQVPVTPHGFLRTPVSIGVRFVAKDVSEASYTREEVLRVTDRPPTQIVFERDEVRRVFAAAP